MLTPQKKVENASIRLMRTHPFYGAIIVGLERFETNECETMQTDGRSLRYNPAFVEKLAPGKFATNCDLTQLTTVLAHEAAHVAACHPIRMHRAKDHRTANEAMDHVVNHILEQETVKDAKGKTSKVFQIPDGGLNDPRFHEMSTEEVYNTLMRDRKDGGSGSGSGQSGGSSDPGGMGEVVPFPSPSGQPQPTDEELAEAEQRQIQKNIEASDISKSIGRTSAGIDRLIDGQTSNECSFRDFLHRFVCDAMCKDDYSFKRPSRRQSSDLILPSLYSPDKGRVIMCVDTSCSISNDALNAAIAECLACLAEYSDSADVPQLPVVYCDSAVCGFEMLEPGKTPEPKGGGGTDFAPAIAYAEERVEELNLNAIVYFTDGECNSFGKEPSVPVLWIINNTVGSFKGFNPPYGEKCHFNNN